MAKVASATGAANFDCDIPNPPGLAGGDTSGYRNVKIFSIAATFTVGATPSTNVDLGIRRNAVTQVSFGTGITVVANTSKELIYTFPEGLEVPGAPTAGQAVDITGGGTNVTACKVVVTYDYCN